MRNVLVTGGSAGIGLAIATAFLDAGDRVFTIARRAMEPLVPHHSHVRADLANWNEAAKACAQIVAQTGTIDVLVNNVGKSEWRPVERIDQAFFDDMMALNVASYIAVTQAVLPSMGGGSTIINISSMAAKRGTANNSMYCATKFAISGLTQSWAKEFGPRGIRVNAICPVLVRSEGLDAALVLPDAPARNQGIETFLAGFTSSQTALGRLPVADDVAHFCLVLAGNSVGALTGQSINLDCGVFPQ